MHGRYYGEKTQAGCFGEKTQAGCFGKKTQAVCSSMGGLQGGDDEAAESGTAV